MQGGGEAEKVKRTGMKKKTAESMVKCMNTTNSLTRLIMLKCKHF